MGDSHVCIRSAMESKQQEEENRTSFPQFWEGGQKNLRKNKQYGHGWHTLKSHIWVKFRRTWLVIEKSKPHCMADGPPSWHGTTENNVVPLQTTVTSTWGPRLCRQPLGTKATPHQDTRPMVPMLRIYKQSKKLATEDVMCRKVHWGQFGEVPQGPEFSS